MDDRPVQYSNVLGYVFIFNLIVGTGTLAVPKTFQDSGYVLALCVLIVLAFFSYVAFTYVIESMAVVNALKKNAGKHYAEVPQSVDGVVLQTENDDDEMRKPFEIEKRFELGAMANILLGKFGMYAFYLCLAIYLYGDLAIYSTVVPKSLANVLCNSAWNKSTLTGVSNETKPELCWPGAQPSFTRTNVYRMLVLAFAVSIGPFVFFNVSKTKYLQIFTNASRWISLILMIGLASKILISGKGEGRPPKANFLNFSNLFGVTVYAFMCHHSLPSVITPMRSKASIFCRTSAVFSIIVFLYSAVSLTGAFAFESLEDIYTLNFLDRDLYSGNPSLSRFFIVSEFIDYFLALFPVFTLSTNFPIVGVTLRNNLITLFWRPLITNDESAESSASSSIRRDSTDHFLATQQQEPMNRKTWLLQKILIPIVVVLPPIIVSMLTDNVELLVSVTGSYAGVCVQYVLPALLAWGTRNYFLDSLNFSANPYKSPFGSIYCIYALFSWAVLSIIFVTVNHILKLC